MAHILFDQGKKVGEISDWSLVINIPTTKNILGKTVVVPAKKNDCHFVSPKPVNRRSKLTVIEDGKIEYVLEISAVRGATVVTASIVKQNKI
ncbi:MAG: hypothetical protein H7061_10290 [Bdellovibrionaceae bacterium]|nr:hypothetical protein [Bdellovibrio sp.]